MAAVIDGPLARALERNREEYNALLRLTAASGRSFDYELLRTHLHDVIAPAVAAVERLDPDAIYRVTTALFAISLELLASPILGSATPDPAVADAWRRLLPALPQLLRIDAHRVAAAIANGPHNIRLHVANPARWIDLLLEAAPRLATVDELLDAGRVAAWRIGMAHYREAALDAAARLSPEVARKLLDLPAGLDSFTGALERLRDDPWFDAEGIPDGSLRIVRSAGAFRGFGGLFIAPPRVTVSNGRFLVHDGGSCFLMAADRFGATFLQTREAFEPVRTTAPFVVGDDGRISVASNERTGPKLRDITSASSDGRSLAVTVAHSHAVMIVS